MKFDDIEDELSYWSSDFCSRCIEELGYCPNEFPECPTLETQRIMLRDILSY